jgi:hypothetical protein
MERENARTIKRKKLAKNSPTLARNKPARVGHPKAFLRIEGRPPAEPG